MTYFSIIIPVYNTAPYLKECLNSIINQTFPDWECICIDDGSTDDSFEILNEYAQSDRRFLIYHQENQGQSVARNEGLEKSCGEFFTFVDSDDILLPTALDDWHKILVKYNCDVLIETDGFISFQDINELDFSKLIEKQLNGCQPLPNSKVALKYLFFDSNVGGTTCGKVYRYEKCGHLRFPTHLRYAEDSTFYLALFREKLSWCAVSSKHYCYRRNRAGSHSLNISAIEKVGYFENSVDHLALLNDNGFSQEDCSRFWEHSIGATMRYVCGGPEECYNLINKEGKKRFQLASRRAKHYLGYYPFAWTMRFRVEILQGHFEKSWRLFELLWYGLSKKLLNNSNNG